MALSTFIFCLLQDGCNPAMYQGLPKKRQLLATKTVSCAASAGELQMPEAIDRSPNNHINGIWYIVHSE